MRKRILLSLLIACLVPVPTTALQTSELDQLDQKLKQHVKEKVPGWQHTRGELIQGSRDVLVQWWRFPNRIVKVSVVPRESPEDAQVRMLAFVKNESEIERLEGLGNEAYARGDGKTNIIFRKNRYTVYVSTTADIDADYDARMLDPAQKTQRRKSEMKRLSKEFAKYIGTAIDESPQE